MKKLFQFYTIVYTDSLKPYETASFYHNLITFWNIRTCTWSTIARQYCSYFCSSLYVQKNDTNNHLNMLTPWLSIKHQWMDTDVKIDGKSRGYPAELHSQEDFVSEMAFFCFQSRKIFLICHFIGLVIDETEIWEVLCFICYLSPIKT